VRCEQLNETLTDASCCAKDAHLHATHAFLLLGRVKGSKGGRSKRRWKIEGGGKEDGGAKSEQNERGV